MIFILTYSFKPLVLSFVATLSYGLVFHVPKKALFLASLVGGVSWMLYNLLLYYDNSKVVSAFFATIIVAVCGDFLSRYLKEPVVVFIIPGIIPYVPGAGMYFIMQQIISGKYDLATKTTVETIFVAGAIAIGLMVAGYILRIIISAFRGIKKDRHVI